LKIKKISPVALSIVLFSFFLAGCAGLTKKPPEPPVSQESQAEALNMVSALVRSGQEISTMAAKGSIEYKNNNTNHFFRFEVVSRRPSSFYFTVLDPLNRPAYRIVSDGQRLMALEYGSAQATIGEDQNTIQVSIFPTSFSPSDFISLLAATLIPIPVNAEMVSSDAGKTVLMVSPGGHWLSSSWLVNASPGPNGLKIDGFTATVGSDPPTVASYSLFAPQVVENIGKTIDFPGRLDLSWGSNQSFLVRYEEIRLGFEAPAELFSTAVPSGFTVTEL
jgi:outer membrane lipoprotein-sorting protein